MLFKRWFQLDEMAKYNADQLEEMGYEFRVENNLPKRLSIRVIKDNIWVCEASFTQDEQLVRSELSNWDDVWDDEDDPLKPNQMWVTNVWTDPKHQRLGIASAAYTLAEKVSGNQIVRTPATTPESDAIWNQPNRPFGR